MGLEMPVKPQTKVAPKVQAKEKVPAKTKSKPQPKQVAAAPKKPAAKVVPKKVIPKPATERTDPRVKYQFTEEEVIGMLHEGKSLKSIARHYKCAFAALWKWCHAESDRSARVRESMEYSSHMYAEMAEEVLLAADENPMAISKARELAQHYRWMAKVRAPRVYGEKMQVEADIKTTPDQVQNQLLATLTALQVKQGNDNSSD